MPKIKVDLLKIDMEAGKPWIQLVRDEELEKRHRSIHTKHRIKHRAKQKARRESLEK